MKINVVGHHIEVTEALRQAAEKKLQRLAHHFAEIAHIDVTLKVENISQIAEANLHIPQGNDIHATACSEDIYNSLDELTKKLEKQLEKHKEKLLKRHHGGKHIIEE